MFTGWSTRLRVAFVAAVCAAAVILAVVTFPSSLLPRSQPMSAADMATNLQFPGKPYRVVVSPDRRHQLYVCTQYVDETMCVFVAKSGERPFAPRAIYLGPQHAVRWRGDSVAAVGNNAIDIRGGHLDADNDPSLGDGLGFLMALPGVLAWAAMVLLLAVVVFALLLAVIFMPMHAKVQEADLANW